jgi:hypothetical protein
MNFIIELLIKTFAYTVYLTGMIILTGLLLGILRTNSIKNFQKSFGSKAVMLTGFIGVPIHELSHTIFALVFGHKVTSIKLFQKPDENGIMGYVNHTYNPLSIYQQIGNFFIGVAPIFGGTISIIVLMRFIIPKAYIQFMHILMKNLYITTLNKATIDGILISYGGLIKSIFSLRNFTNQYFFIFLLIAICISSHMSLSSADIKGASRGIGIIFLIFLILNIFSLSKYIVAINLIKYNILLIGFFIVAVILSIITFLLSLFLVLIKRASIN